MNELLQGMLLALIPSLIVSMLTAFLTVKLSMKQFYSQRWWEKKAEVYSTLIQNMSYMKYYFGDCYDEITGVIRGSKESYDEYHKATIYLKNMAGMGGFLVSRETAGLLTKLLGQTYDDNIPKSQTDELADYDNRLKAISEAIDKIKEYAKRDLIKN